MFRYFFDVTDGGTTTPDPAGILLTDDDEARDEALGICTCIARDIRPRGDRHEVNIAARNDTGEVVYEVTLSLDGRWWPRRQ